MNECFVSSFRRKKKKFEQKPESFTFQLCVREKKEGSLLNGKDTDTETKRKHRISKIINKLSFVKFYIQTANVARVNSSERSDKWLQDIQVTLICKNDAITVKIDRFYIKLIK